VAVFWGAYLGILALASNVKAVVPQQCRPLVWALTSSAAILPLTLLFLRREHRKVHEVGLDLNRTSFLRLLSGVFIGVAVFGFQVLALSLVAGPIHFSRAGDVTPNTLVTAVSTILALSCMEELGFRGYPLRSLVRGFGLWPAQGIVAVAFGLCHIAFGWSWKAILLGVVPSGLLFGMAAISSQGLAMPIGVHAGVNLAQSLLRDNSSWGIWKLVMDKHVRGRVETLSPIVGAAVVTLAMLAFWWWHQSCRTGQDKSNASAGAARAELDSGRENCGQLPSRPAEPTGEH